VGVHADTRAICISAYAKELLERTLEPLRPAGQGLRLRVIFPTGRQLAERTSNAAFGVVEGLALIGTQAETQASLPPSLLLKCGNWLGPVLVAAGQGGVRRLLLFGNQGKLIKLAGGIFHTHHHLADGRLEILTAHAALEGLAGEALQALHQAPTVEAAVADLERRDAALAERLRRRLASAIEARSLDYLTRHDGAGPAVGAVLFDRGRRIRACGPVGEQLLRELATPEAGDQPTPRVQTDS